MEDLVYTYKKGVGWVLVPPHDRHECVIKGYNIVLEHRKPNLGERFYYLMKISSFMSDDRINWDVLVASVSLFNGPDFNSGLYDENANTKMFLWDSQDATHVTITATRAT